MTGAAYQALVKQVRTRVEAFVRATWAASPAYRDADVERLVSLLVPVVQAGQLQVASLTSAYIAGVSGAPAVPVDRDDVLAARGVAAAEVYRRPAVTVYTELAAGKPFVDAVKAGATRLVSLAMTDVQLAKVRQSRASYASTGVTYFRRVLTGNEDCALCVIASTQRYRKSDLLPIHPGCDCDTAPVKADEDPGQVLDQALLDSVHEQVGRFTDYGDRGARELGIGKTSAKGEELKDFTELIVTRQHGEYGPTLSWRRDEFAGPNDI